MFTEKDEDLKIFVDELFLWYEQTELPVYIPKKPTYNIEIPKSISVSILCHVSVRRLRTLAQQEPSILELKRGAWLLGGGSGSGLGSTLPSNQTLEGRRTQMAHFRQPKVANSAPPARQSAYGSGRTIHGLLQLWCFGQFSQEILPLLSGKAAADLSLIHQPALNPLTEQQRTYGLFAPHRDTTDNLKVGG